MFTFDGVAFETVKNNSVCIIEDGFIRNINSLDDAQRHLLVFVSNPMGDVYNINRGERVRVFKIGQFL